MTTATPTADPAGAAAPWLPDEAALARLANEFFAALPGQEPVTPTTAVPDLQRAAAAAGYEPAAAAGYGPAAAAGYGLAAVVPGYGPAAVPGYGPTAAAGYEPAAAAGYGPAAAAGYEPAAVVPGYGPAAAVPGYGPAAASPGPLPADGAASPAAAAPERQLAQPHQKVFALPGLGATAVPSFYFVNELPAAAGPAPAFPPGAQPGFDVEGIRRDFPILAERVNGRQLVWLDNAATTQKPQPVIDRLAYFYARENSNVHRGAHALAARATDAYEGARATVADFLGAPSSESVVFARGTTEAINLVARAWGPAHLTAGDEIVLSQLEHHANIVPWQQLAEQTGARLKVIPVGDDGQLLLDAYADLLTDRTRLVAVSQVSNVLGTIVPVSPIVEAAHRAGAAVLIDGAQAVAHLPLDVSALDIDFYVFSGHKIFAPTGIGVLYGKPEILAGMPPWQGGGNMISDVTFERTSYAAPPARFEAGTGSIADAVALGTALDYVSRAGLPGIARYEHELLRYATAALSTVPGLRLIGTAPEKTGVLSFVLAGYQPEQVGSALDQEGIAVRAGHHCAQPILRRYGLESAVRASLAMYNTRAEVDLLAAALRRLAADAGRR